jgi:predicted DNA-binding WGR domain protein
MPAIDAIKIVLQAVNPALNRSRSWSLEAGQDLFGHWTARVSFGRIGCRGRTMVRELASEDEVWAFLRKGLRRRRTALRRCGAAYRVVEASPATQWLLTNLGIECTNAARGARNEDPANHTSEPIG